MKEATLPISLLTVKAVTNGKAECVISASLQSLVFNLSTLLSQSMLFSGFSALLLFRPGAATPARPSSPSSNDAGPGAS